MVNYGKRKRSKRRYSKKRTFKRRKKAYLPIGVPQKHIVKLRYGTVVNIDSAGAVTDHYFRANSLYDPDYTGVGSQPRFFDQWATLYGNYCVIGSKMTIEAYYDSTTRAATKVYYGLAKETSVPSSFADMLEQKGVRSFFLTENGNKVVQKRSCEFSAKKWFRVKNVLDETNLSCGMSSNPASPAYFYIGVVSADGIDDPPNVVFNVVIDYIAVLRSPVNVSQS